MSEREKKMLVAVRRAVIQIMQALIEYYGMGWDDFKPRSALVRAEVPVVPWSTPSSTPPPEFRG
jgi:hypothetical protein